MLPSQPLLQGPSRASPLLQTDMLAACALLQPLAMAVLTTKNASLGYRPIQVAQSANTIAHARYYAYLVQARLTDPLCQQV